MRATIEVANRREAEAIRTALDDPATRAFVILLPLSDRARKRVLQFVIDSLNDKPEAEQ